MLKKTVVKYRQYEIYHLNHLQLYTSGMLSIFTLSVMITTIRLQNSFHFPNKRYSVNRDHPLHPCPLETTILCCLYELYYSYVFT